METGYSILALFIIWAFTVTGGFLANLMYGLNNTFWPFNKCFKETPPLTRRFKVPSLLFMLIFGCIGITMFETYFYIGKI